MRKLSHLEAATTAPATSSASPDQTDQPDQPNLPTKFKNKKKVRIYYTIKQTEMHFSSYAFPKAFSQILAAFVSLAALENSC
jgi:hypothetical protein